MARILNDRGYRTRTGKKWNMNAIRRMLEDSTPKGIHRANWTRSKGSGRNWEVKPEEDWVLNDVEPILKDPPAISGHKERQRFATMERSGAASTYIDCADL